MESLKLAGQPAAPPEPVDIGLLIKDMHKLDALIAPLRKLTRLLHRVLRWDSPLLCVLILTVVNFTCIAFPTGQYMVVQLSVIGLAAGLGISHLKYRLLTKVLPTPPRNPTLPNSHNHSQQMQDFRELLASVKRWLTKANALFVAFYSLIKWDNVTLSIRCYLVLTVGVVLMNLLPLRWVISLAINLTFLYAPCNMLLERRQAKKMSVASERAESQANLTTVGATPSTDTDAISFSQLSVSEAGEAMEDSDLDEDDMSEKFESGSSGPEFSDNDDSADLPPGEPGEAGGVSEISGVKVKDAVGSKGSSGMMSRINEFRKRHQQAGACIGCNVTFTSILKRRRTCTYCGNHFCSKCCSNKVPKAFFGATAPSAQQETVLVCHFCHNFLTAGDKKGQ